MKMQSITCQQCKKQFEISAKDPSRFCPFCGNPLHEKGKIGNRYQILETIGKGGMGEVLLAFDSTCERRIALKRIRSDLVDHPQVKTRFLKEAHITCQLTHPAIIPIYTIHDVQSHSYYTMPYVEGKTLKEIIRKTRHQEKASHNSPHSGASIPSLMRTFLIVCQAVAYAHSKGVLHRDLKMENVIVGKYGEVLILDWGLAKYIEDDIGEDDSLVTEPKNANITRVGKIVGTIAYMAPERAFGHPATVKTDIYSLGVMLYQMLTLRIPFRRGKTIEEFRKKVTHEELIDPVVLAPYRDIPRMLSRISQKCLAVDPQDRYQSVDELIHDLENYIEGRSEWFPVAQLDIKEKQDWEFQENVLIAEHMAITHATEEALWVNLMISKSSFTGNTKLETEVCLQEKGHGIGFLLSVPESSERVSLTSGYCLWIGSDINRSTKLMRSNVEVVDAPDIYLKRHEKTRIRVEKVEQSLHLYINDTLQLSYIAHLPLIGTHIGLLTRDADFEIQPIEVFVGSLNIMVNCLAVPDAFLAHEDFPQALSEYRRIAYTFPDWPEGREALFRAGLTFIEQAKKSPNRIELLDKALEEFEKLHETPGAPLEYLGKAIVYQTLNEETEEIKCFELAYHRYPKHPLLAVLQEQVISRMHEIARYHRIAAYHIILLAVRHFPGEAIDTHTKRLFNSLQRHWEYLPFVEEDPSKDKQLQYTHFAIQLAFWLAKPYIIEEILKDLIVKTPVSQIALGNALFSLIELGSWQFANTLIGKISSQDPALTEIPTLSLLQTAIEGHLKPLDELFDFIFLRTFTIIEFEEWRTIIYLLNLALDQNNLTLIHTCSEKLHKSKLTSDQMLQLDEIEIWAYLLEKNWNAAADTLNGYPIELLNKESTLLHFLYGCWLQATEGKEIAMIHFSGILNAPYPRSWTLASHYLIEYLNPDSTWFSKAFLWEKRQLYRQLSLYYACSGNTKAQEDYKQLYLQQFVNV